MNAEGFTLREKVGASIRRFWYMPDTKPMFKAIGTAVLLVGVLAYCIRTKDPIPSARELPFSNPVEQAWSDYAQALNQESSLQGAYGECSGEERCAYLKQKWDAAAEERQNAEADLLGITLDPTLVERVRYFDR
ncbi:MAG: hypothetical protein WCV90_04130 [Candidatus Woesearchaeota archaeon]|jgi:hypothetical protein